jgi:acyl-CoA thioesterase-2
MSRVLEELLHLLKLEAVGDDVFLGRSQDLGWGRVYGGQVLGQALSAAERTVDPTRLAHSFHSYFLRPGNPAESIEYRVERTRDGRSFSTRRIRAEQGGRPIFFMAASFQIPEVGLEHHDAAPDITGPDGLLSFTDLIRKHADLLPGAMSDWAMMDFPIEMRPVEISDPMNLALSDPVQHLWLRAKSDLPDDPALHRYLLAYASDFILLDTALLPHGKRFWDGSLRMASIDHAMWFHHDIKMDDWLLYSLDSPSASGARGLVRGQFFDRSGRLVASLVQEGLIRPVDPN